MERSRSAVRRQFRALGPLAALDVAQKGWVLDVLSAVRALGKPVFTLREVLAHAAALQRLHPENRHVAAKVRQQLQRLRDLELLEFVDNRGTYRMR